MKTSIFSWIKIIFVLLFTIGFHASPLLAESPTLAESNTFASRQLGGQAQEKSRQEILLLARAIYSETKNEKNGEMVKVGCVIRNRVETGYRGVTYEEVVFAEAQFSGLNPRDRQYLINTTIDYENANPAWRNALQVAGLVYNYGELICQFPLTVRHFYSPVAVKKTPEWALGKKPVDIIYNETGTGIRFAFYEGVK